MWIPSHLCFQLLIEGFGRVIGRQTRRCDPTLGHDTSCGHRAQDRGTPTRQRRWTLAWPGVGVRLITFLICNRTSQTSAVPYVALFLAEESKTVVGESDTSISTFEAEGRSMLETGLLVLLALSGEAAAANGVTGAYL